MIYFNRNKVGEILMDFEIDKLENIALHKSLFDKNNFSDSEIAFMRYIYNTIIDSEDYDSICKYLAKIYNTNISVIKFIRNTYFTFFASNDEKQAYIVQKNTKQSKLKKNYGFVNISIIILIMVLIFIFGIFISKILYDL